MSKNFVKHILIILEMEMSKNTRVEMMLFYQTTKVKEKLERLICSTKKVKQRNLPI